MEYGQMANRFPLVSAGMGVLVVLALMLSFFLPWYHVYHADAAHIVEWDDRFLLSERTVVMNSDERTYPYGNGSYLSDWPSIGELMDRQIRYVFAGIFLGVGLALAVSFRRWKAAFVVGIALFGMLVLSMYDFWSNIDSAINSRTLMDLHPIDGFWGETTTSNVIWYHISWGPMLGWWLVVLALVTDLVMIVTSAMKVAASPRKSP